MLVRRYYMKDIKEFEEDNNCNLLDMFEGLDLNNILELVSLGNGKCGLDFAGKLLDDYLFNHTLIEALEEVKVCLFCKNDTDGESMDISKYDSLSDIYSDFCMELMSIGVNYGEFWDMTTSDMYRVFNSITKKVEADMNRQLSLNHTLAAMIGGAVWGKLDKEPPRVGSVQSETSDKEIENMDSGTFQSVLALKSIVNKQQYVKEVSNE